MGVNMDSNRPDQLFNNPAVFSRGGVVGRGNFVVNVILSFTLLAALYWVVSDVYLAPGVGSAARNFVFQILFVVSFVYLVAINVFKRVRDIRGTIENENPIFLAAVLLLFVPVVNILVLIFLASAKGAFMDKDFYYAQFEGAIRSKLKSFVEVNGANIEEAPKKHPESHRHTKAHPQSSLVN